MDKEIDEMLQGAIADEIKSLSKFNPESKEHDTVVNNIATLCKIHIDDIKSESEINIKRQEMSDTDYAHEKERRLKEAQFEFDKKDRYIRIALAGAELIVPLVFYGVWMKMGFKFEETGTYTSHTFRNLFNRFRPKN